MTAPGKVFISHASADKPFVDRLATDLGKRGVPIWYDKFDFHVGNSIPGEINDALISSKYFLIVLSPCSVISRWVKEELNAALVTQVAQAGTFLIPVLYEPCEVPPLIRHRRYADFTKDYKAGLNELLTVFGKDAEISAELEGKTLYPWPDASQPDKTQCYLYSTRFDKFFRLSCDLIWSVSETIDYIVDTLRLPWNIGLTQLGMRWSFSYGILYNDTSLPLSQTLEQAGVSAGSVLKLNINGNYEDLWENELHSMWDGSKIYEVISAMRHQQDLEQRIRNRGRLTSARLKEISNSCFAHV